MSPSIYYFLEYTAIFILMGWAIYIVYRAGQIYNGVVFTMIVGAYFTAVVSTKWEWPFWLALLGSISCGAFFAFIPALGLARTRAFTMAIATIGLIFITHTVIQNIDFLGGVRGIFRIPRVKNLLLISYITVFIVGFIIYRLDHSHIGRAMETSFIDPDLAVSLGLNRYWLSVFLQVLAGAIGAIAGSFNAVLIGTIMYQNFGFSILLLLFCFLFIGGYTTMWGVAVFTPILWAVSSFLPEAVSGLRDLIYGALLIIILIVRPEGVIDKDILKFLRTGSTVLLKRLFRFGNSRV